MPVQLHLLRRQHDAAPVPRDAARAREVAEQHVREQPRVDIAPGEHEADLAPGEFLGMREHRREPCGARGESRGITPYGLDVAPDGKIWYTKLNGQRVGRIDPKLADGDPEQIVEWKPPIHGPRRLHVAPNGVVWVPGFASGDIPRIPANILMVKNITAIGYYWGAHRIFAPEMMQESFTELLSWLADGSLKPHVSRTYDLAKAPTALEALKARKTTGKVVLTVEPETI